MNGVSSRRDGGVLQLTLDRPEKLNAVNTPMLRELRARLIDATDESIRVVALTGAGRAFCSGGDLSGQNTRGASVAANQVVAAIAGLPKPVVAGVRGAATGFGCGLALACDMVVAAKSAFFQLAFTRVGLMPDGGTSALLSAAIGRVRATRLTMFAEKVTAATAFDWGMISHIVDDDIFDEEFEAVVQQLASGPTQSYGWIKRALTESTLPALSQVQAIEVEGQDTLVGTADFRAGVEAFRTRSQPIFEGR
jgi:enoyl-CoA hydratase